MGEHADDAFDHWLSSQFETRTSTKSQSWQFGSGNFMWRDREGNILAMREMETSHIENAIQMCDRHNNTAKRSQLQTVLWEREHELTNAMSTADWRIFLEGGPTVPGAADVP